MNAAQTLTFSGALVSGTSTFTLSVDGATTAAIPYNSNSTTLAAAINSAFSTLAAIGTNSNIFNQYNPIAVANGTTGPISIAFQNVPVGANVGVTPYLSVSAVTGGGSAAIGQTLGTGTVALWPRSIPTAGTTTVNQGTLSLKHGGGSLASQSTSAGNLPPDHHLGLELLPPSAATPSASTARARRNTIAFNASAATGASPP